MIDKPTQYELDNKLLSQWEKDYIVALNDRELYDTLVDAIDGADDCPPLTRHRLRFVEHEVKIRMDLRR
jgi:hypothetical protein